MIQSALLQDSLLIAQSSVPSSAADFGLGWPGLCSSTPCLNIAVFDDSGSITGAGGTDPVGNRYVETRAAFGKLGAWCSCRNCLAAVVHFDTPGGDSDVGRLASSRYRRELGRALQDPCAGGNSLITSSLNRVDELMSRYPKHRTRLVIFSDWELFDVEDYTTRLVKFPGELLAIGLNRTPPEDLEGPGITSLRVDYQDEPGTVARAMFGSLTRGRRGKP